ncbi:hypothetical protein StrepF001_11145 [Streptomyces sp. F001]|nr:hypothetical protein StrepF001_11145 [Streptomyces sp. F001]
MGSGPARRTRHRVIAKSPVVVAGSGYAESAAHELDAVCVFLTTLLGPCPENSGPSLRRPAPPLERRAHDRLVRERPPKRTDCERLPQHSEAHHLNWALITVMTRRLTCKSPNTSHWTRTILGSRP